MGRLYLGRDPDPNIDRLVAIKLLREGFDNKELRERFNREAKSASALRHANIVTIFETGTHEGQPFIVMEYIHGDTLADLINRRDHLTLERKIELMEALFGGLYYAHRKHIIHRDIKPANMMIDDDGGLRILDFGIARLGRGSSTGPGLTQVGAVMGTLNYIAPEQLRAEPIIDGRADMFSAGAVLYELLSLHRAFPGDPPAIFQKIFVEDPRPLRDLCPELDHDLIVIVDRCLRKKPEERYPDCGAVREALHEFRRRLSAEHGAMPTTPVTPIRDRHELLRIRTDQIRRYVEAGRRALGAADFNAALHACQQALLLDPEHAEALAIEERARAGLEQMRLLRQALDDASAELDRGGLTSAAQHVYRALAIDPASVEALRLRQAIDDARRRIAGEQELQRTIADALARGWEALRAGALSVAESCVAEVVAVDPGNQDVEALRAGVAAAAAALRRAEAQATAAREAMEHARRHAAVGNYRRALDILEGFRPAALVADVVAEVRRAEQHARQRTLAAALAHGWEALRVGALAVAESCVAEVLAIDEGNQEAEALRAEVLVALEAARRAESDTKAAGAVIEQARRHAAVHGYRAALDMLERFQPAALVSSAIADMRAAEEVQRQRTIDTALSRGWEALREGALTVAESCVAEVVAVDQGNQEVEALRTELRVAIATARRAQAEAKAARAVVEQARRHVAAGGYVAALEMLERFQPAALVESAIAEVRSALEEAERQKAESAHRQQEERRRQAETERVQKLIAQSIEEATNLLHAKQLDRALSALQTALAYEPQHVKALALRATIREALERDAELKKTIRKPARIAESSAGATREVTSSEPGAARSAFDAMRSRMVIPLGAAAALVVVLAGAMVWRSFGRRPVIEQPTSTASVTEPPPPSEVTPRIPEPNPPSPSPQPPSAAQQPIDGVPKPLADLLTAADDFWRRGETGPALNRLASALRLQPRGTETAALAEEFLRQARERSEGAASIARDLGADKGSTYASAVLRESEGNRLARSQQSVDAVRAYLDAASLFYKASSERRVAAEAPTPPPLPVAPPRPVESAAPVAPAPSLPPPPEPGRVPDAQTVNRPEERPSAAAPAPAVPDNESAIRATLQRYVAAYESLDPHAVKAVYPSIDAAALTAAFRDFTSLKLTLEIQSVQSAADGRTATVQAFVTNAPVVKVGRSMPAQRRRALFTLRKTGDSWEIQSVRLG